MAQPEFTRADCEAWLRDPAKNPKTTRSIKPDLKSGSVYSKLAKACKVYGLNPPGTTVTTPPRAPVAVTTPPRTLGQLPQMPPVGGTAMTPPRALGVAMPQPPTGGMLLQMPRQIPPVRVTPVAPPQIIGQLPQIPPPQRPAQPAFPGIQIPTIPKLPTFEGEEGDEDEDEEEETEEPEAQVIGQLQWGQALVLGDMLTLYRYFKQFPDEATLVRDYPKQPWSAAQGLLVVNALGQNKNLSVAYTEDETGQPTKLTLG
jgi:hypothetical protein